MNSKSSMSANQQHTAGPHGNCSRCDRALTRLEGRDQSHDCKQAEIREDLLAALQRWEEYARANQYSEIEQDSSYCSFLAATRVAISKATS